MVSDFVKSSPLPDVATGLDYVRVFRNDGRMTFTQVYSYSMAGTCTLLKSADMNGDGNQDIVALKKTIERHCNEHSVFPR